MSYSYIIIIFIINNIKKETDKVKKDMNNDDHSFIMITIIIISYGS